MSKDAPPSYDEAIYPPVVKNVLFLMAGLGVGSYICNFLGPLRH